MANHMSMTVPTVITSSQIGRFLEEASTARIILVFPNLQWLDYSFREALAAIGPIAPTVQNRTIRTPQREIVFVTVDGMEKYRGFSGLVAFVVDDAFAEAWAVAHLIGMRT